MHKTITIAIIIAISWIVLSSSHISDAFVNFIIIGAVPGSTATLSPTMMLAILTAFVGTLLFRMLVRRLHVLRKIRYHFTHLTAKQERLPKRRFKRA